MRAPSKRKKLLKGEHVEVRQREDGLRGAWHEGVVIETPSLQRRVKYKHLLDDEMKNGLEENLRVSSTVEGWKNGEGDPKHKQRGYIRPLPPPVNRAIRFSYGLCVDALYDEAWWEGVVYDDAENSSTRSVFFPDEGDELMIPKENLRVTRDWSENRGKWTVRGHWVLTNLRSLCDSRGFSIKVVWYNLRIHKLFSAKVRDWIHGKKNDWIECLNKVFQLLERDPSRQVIPGLKALVTQNHLNGEEGSVSGSGGREDSSQFQNSNEIHKSSLDEDNNQGAIVCCETVNQVWPLDAVAVEDTPVLVSENGNGNELIERLGNGFCNSLESSSKENCFDREFSKALRRSSDTYNKQRKSSLASTNERASLALRKSRNREVKGMGKQINCSDRVLMKDLVNTGHTKQRTGRGKELYRDLAMDTSLEGIAKNNQNQSIKSPPFEAKFKGQIQSINMMLSKTSTRDQFNSKKGTKLSHPILGKGKSLTLASRGKLLEKHNSGHRSPLTVKPSASSNPDDCLEAVLNYNSNSSGREVQARAKMYLHYQGWRFKVTERNSSERQDMHYVSPRGNVYHSLNQACIAWREEQKVERMIDGRREDVWVEGSPSSSSQEPSLRVKRNMLSSVTKFPKRSWRVDTSQQLLRKDSTDDDSNDAFKINNISRPLVIKGKRLPRSRYKKRNVSWEGLSVSELTHGTQTCNFLSNSIARDFELRNTSREESNSKRPRQAPLPDFEWSSKKRKLNLEASMDVQKRKEAKHSCHVWKTKDTLANWHRMPELPSTSGKSNDSSSFQDKQTDIFDLSWLIENGVVANNQQVFFLYGKEGWITRKGIFCKCCWREYKLTSFEAHAGSKVHQFSVNLRLDDGRSLAQCQMQALRKRMRASLEDNRTRTPSKENKKQAPLNKKRITEPWEEHDDFCFVCRQNGEVTLCDRCTKSFHADCVYPERLPGEGEWTKWFCPNCRCDKCGGGEFSDDENFTESTALLCDQCECLFHVGCLEGIGMSELASCPKGKWFCSQNCSEIFSQLRNLVGKVISVGGGLTWTLLRSTEEDRNPSRDEIIAECSSGPLLDKIATKRKLCDAMSIMSDCFTRIVEYRTGKDYIEEIIFNRGCQRNLLRFQGFYTAILEKGDELVSVVTMRIHGRRVAEWPLIATRSLYRRKGMCRLLVSELEKLLNSLHIEKIVLPAIDQLKSTWKESFGFQEMTSEELFDLLKLDIVHFPDTTMLQKILMGASPEQEIVTEIDDSENRAEGMHQRLGNIYGLEIQEGIVPENPGSSAFVESVIPLCSLPGKTSTYVKPHSNSGEGDCYNGKLQSLSKGFQHDGSALRRRCRIRKNKIKKVECHSGKTPMEDVVVIVGTTRSNRLVKQVKRKIGYSCRWEGHKPMCSEEHYLDRKIYKRGMEDRIIVSDEFPAIPPAVTLESSQKKDIQFGTCEITKSDDGKSIVCRTNSGIADGNCFSNINADESILDRSVVEHGSDHAAVTLESSQKKDIQFGTCEITKSDDGKSIVCSTDSGIADGNCFSSINADDSILDRLVVEHESDHAAVTLESSLKKDIQFGTCELTKSDDGKSIACRADSGIADGNCFSNINADDSILDRLVVEHGSDHAAVNRENVCGDSHTIKCNENFRENYSGHLGAQYSFKYVYMRRRKRSCS